MMVCILCLFVLPSMAKNGCTKFPHAIGYNEVKSDGTCNKRNIGNQVLYVKETNVYYTPANCTSLPNENVHCILSYNAVTKEKRVYTKPGCTGIDYYVHGAPVPYRNAAQKTNEPCTHEGDPKPQA